MCMLITYEYNSKKQLLALKNSMCYVTITVRQSLLPAVKNIQNNILFEPIKIVLPPLHIIQNVDSQKP
jgi:hypothetical protein